MIDFKISRDKALTALEKIEAVTVLEEWEKNKLGLKDNGSVWEVSTEIKGTNEKRVDIVLYVFLKDDFPLTFPKIYLSKATYDALKYLPHVDPDKFVCTFDSELARPNPENPEGVITDCLQKAKKILEEGIAGLNKQDFEDEFLAYWRCSYFLNDKDVETLCFINQNTVNINPFILKLSKKVGVYKYFLHNNDSEAEKLKVYLTANGFEFTEIPAFYCRSIKIGFKPPFDFNNADTLKLIETAGIDSLERFKKFINKGNSINFVLSSVEVNGKMVFIGWLYKNFLLTRNGFRQGSITTFAALSNFQRADKIVRAIPEIFTNERLMARTGGNKNNSLRLAMIGVGSVGSNLIHFLNSINYPNFRLIDKDTLKVENIGRHLLGFSDLSKNKTSAIQEYLKQLNPMQEVQTREDTIVNVLSNEPDFINEADFIFSSTGKTNIDKWISDALDGAILKKPIFFIWVEPHLAGGHCIYAVPKGKSYTSFFSREGLFDHNVIDAEYYRRKDNKLSLKETGCQTTYIPYSSSNVISFLSALFPKIASIIESNATETKAFTWIGNLRYINELDIPLSEFAKAEKQGNLITH